MPRIFASNALPAPFAWRHADEDYGKSAEPDWRHVDWQAHLRQTRIDDRSVVYVDMGQGDPDPLVLVHGLSGCWQNWLETLPAISQTRRVVALDLPGFGESEMPAWRISISRYAETVEKLCDQLGLGAVDVVGNSMGGFVSAEFAIRYPDRVDRLVLASAAGISSANVYRTPALTAGRIGAAVMANRAIDHRYIAARPRARQLALGLVVRHPRLLAADVCYEGLLRGADKPGFYRALRACIEYDYRERLPEIRSPTLIVWGENDTILSVRDADEYERLIPNTKKLVMRDTGHVPQIERPEAFNSELLEFLETARVPAREREAA
jgi:pimeloyl-ACP methyl ester carboxylesterase